MVAFIADLTGHDDGDANHALATGTAAEPASFAIDGAAWDPDDGDDPDAAVWADPVVRPLRVRSSRPTRRRSRAFRSSSSARATADPSSRARRSRTRTAGSGFPIDLAMEQEHEVVIAARAVPGTRDDEPGQGRARPADRGDVRRSTAESGRRSRSLDPEGRPIDGPRPRAQGHPRRRITEPARGPTLLGQVFGETTPRAIRKPGASSSSASGPPTTSRSSSRRPASLPSTAAERARPGAGPFPIDVKLEMRTSVVRFDVGVPPRSTRTEPRSRAIGSRRSASSSRRAATRCLPSGTRGSASRSRRTTRRGSRSAPGSTAGSTLRPRSTSRRCARARSSTSGRSASRCCRSCSPDTSSTRIRHRSRTRPSRRSAAAASATSPATTGADGGVRAARATRGAVRTR